MQPAVAYYRVSTDEQAQRGVSLDAQRERVEAFARAEGFELLESFSDPGKTGADMIRPGVVSALKRLDTGQARTLVVAKLDRLTRSLRDFEQLVDRYFGPGKGYTLAVVVDPVDLDTATGRMLARIRLAVAQHELETVIERTADAMSHKRAKGERLGTIPYGWELDPEGARNRDGRLVGLRANPYEMRALDMMRDLRADGRSLDDIAGFLAANGYPTRGGKRWCKQTVAAILRRDAEKGGAA